VQSIDYAKCGPWEWFHLLLENIIPNLVNLWTGDFKGLDMGSENYEIAPEIWAEKLQRQPGTSRRPLCEFWQTLQKTDPSSQLNLGVSGSSTSLLCSYETGFQAKNIIHTLAI
jgi:hypothetical protein